MTRKPKSVVDLDNPPPEAAPYVELLRQHKESEAALASCVLWALKFLQTPHGGGLWTNMTTMESKAWEDKFMDALDGYGYRIDRKLFWKKRDEKKPKKRPQWRTPASKPHALQAR
jgi:hypothetical protein